MKSFPRDKISVKSARKKKNEPHFNIFVNRKTSLISMKLK